MFRPARRGRMPVRDRELPIRDIGLQSGRRSRELPTVSAASDCQVFVFLLLDGLSLMSLASAIEPLRSCNRLLGRTTYQWVLASVSGQPVAASNGIELQTVPAEDALTGASILFAVGGLRVRPKDERRHLALLRRAARQGVTLGALSTGSYLLARAGLLNGYRCTIHWENRPAFIEDFPDLDCTDRLYEIDRNRLTCSGGTASMDLMLRLIADRHGPDIARRVANQFHHQRIRGTGDGQRGGRLDHSAGLPSSIEIALRTMAEHIEDPLSIPALASCAGVSTRQLERLFLRYAHMPPARYYLSLRIDRARELLTYSDRPLLEVVVASGFTSVSHFAVWFRRFHGMRPSELREQARRGLA